MSGIKYLLDTNVIIGMYQKTPAVLALLADKNININECAYSSITKMELLSFPAITESEIASINSLLDRMLYLNISEKIEKLAIAFRRVHKTKLPDSIIAATAQALKIELLTLDRKLAAKVNLTD
ncbi:type II toxin-antitoxin system VapC family toxin [Methylovulum miyakonense]|uniref:type II toxin-antitoxin system VapC family toxin n=1 Tax=Methylovulum miyakonense TaxID=645578 RepID=UPI000376EB19|nr:type II toxin-antitoxin system VapC family toxin [Methylovulum miyakonense]